MYVYINSEPGLWTVGFYHPDGKWESESDHEIAKEAAERVAWLNGATKPAKEPKPTRRFFDQSLQYKKRGEQ